MNGRKWWKTHQNENDDRKYRRRVFLQPAHRVQPTFQCAGQSKTHQNGSVDANRSMKTHTFENTFVWTGPQVTFKQIYMNISEFLTFVCANQSLCRHVYVTIGLATSFIYSFTVISLSLYSSLIFQFLSFFQGTAHRVTELLASRLGRDKVILNHPVASIKQVTIKVTVTVLGRHDLLLLMS